MKTKTYDVIIVGSGVAGALCAYKLAQAKKGLSILVLEAGANDLDDRQRAAFHRVNSVQGPGWKSPYARMSSRPFAPYPEAPEDPKKEKYFDHGTETDVTKIYKAPYIRMTGGSTWAWRGNTPRFLPNDLKLSTLYSELEHHLDWPLTYEQLKADFDEAESELGVAGDSDAWEKVLGHKLKFPMPPIPLSYGDQLMQKAINGLGTVAGRKVQVISTPQARNSEPYDNNGQQGRRPACEGNSNCIPLCPIQAKYDASVHLKLALSAGVELRNGCVVTKLAADGSGKVTTVRYRSWLSSKPGEELEVNGRVFVLAANAIETPKLLLLSRTDSAFTNPSIGRYLMDHVQEEAVGLFKEPVFPFRGPQSTCGIENFRDGDFRGKHAGFRMTVGNDGWGRKETVGTTLDNLLRTPGVDRSFLFGKALRRAVADRITRMVRVSFSIEVLPHQSNCVEVDTTPAGKKDDFGIPRPKLKFNLTDYEWKGLEEGHKAATEILKRIGCEVADEPAPKNFNTAAHPMGTCRMGKDKVTSVVDDEGRSHEHANLFMAGASVFTTASSANPTLMLAALTLRTVRAVLKHLGKP